MIQIIVIVYILCKIIEYISLYSITQEIRVIDKQIDTLDKQLYSACQAEEKQIESKINSLKNKKFSIKTECNIK